MFGMSNQSFKEGWRKISIKPIPFSFCKHRFSTDMKRAHRSSNPAFEHSTFNTRVEILQDELPHRPKRFVNIFKILSNEALDHPRIPYIYAPPSNSYDDSFEDDEWMPLFWMSQNTILHWARPPNPLTIIGPSDKPKKSI